MPLILIGPGINHLVEVSELPTTGTELNLESIILKPAVYRLTRDGARTLGGTEYPFYRFQRTADLPDGVIPISMAVMNC
jgi:hypothetical protein